MMKHFTIYPWNHFSTLSEDPYADMKEIAECGFNASCFISPAQVDACRAAGLDMYIFPGDPYNRNLVPIAADKNATEAQIREIMNRLLDSIPEDAAAIYILDEPSTREFRNLEIMARCVRECFPHAEPYFNLFPNYAVCGAEDISQLGAETYEEYLDAFARIVKPDAISLDNYFTTISMDFKHGEKDRQFYFLNLIQARECCTKYNLPFQHVVNCNQLRAHLVPPSFANLAFQAYTSLAAGAKAIGWFTYIGRSEYFFAPIDDTTGTHVKTDTWYMLREINRRILPVGNLLFDMEWVEMYFTNHDRIPRAKFIDECRTIRGFSSDEPCMIGHFRSREGEDVFLVVNTSLERSSRIHMDIGGEIVIFSHNDGRFDKPHLTNASGAKSPLWLNAGCGIVLKKCR